MRAAPAPTLRDLHHGLVPTVPEEVRPKSYRWIDDDPELTPRKARAELPLSAWG